MQTYRLNIKTKFPKLIGLLRGFRADQHGNIGIMFAFAMLPIVAFVGSAIDYSRGNAVKVEMQSAFDSVGLMLYRTASTMSPTDLQAAAQNYLNATFAKKFGADNVQVSASIRLWAARTSS